MKRVFITTNVGQTADMYSRTGHETRKIRVEADFADLSNGKEYIYNDDFKVIVLTDTFSDWTAYNIVQTDDYILYHISSADNIKNTITATFSPAYIQSGSHNLNQFHDKVYRIIFDDKNNKPERILTALNFTHEGIGRKNKLEALILINKSLTLLPLKGKWLKDTFETTKRVLESSKNIETAKGKLSSINYKEDVEEFLKQLEPIETEIVNLSTSK